MTKLKTWKSLDGAAGAAVQQAALTGVPYAIVAGYTRRDFMICAEGNLGPDRAKRTVGRASPEGVFTAGRVPWTEAE